MELRRFPRVSLQCPIGFLRVGDHTVGGGHAVNVSMAGCAVESDERVRQGDHLSVIVMVPEQGPPIGISKARVRWSLGNKFGVEFVGLTPQARERVHQLVSSLESQPSHESHLPPSPLGSTPTRQSPS